MKRAFALLIALCFACTAAPLSFAADKAADTGQASAAEEKATGAKSDKKPAPREKKRSFTGEVKAVDAAAGSITVRRKATDKIFAADEQQLSGIKVGDKVTVTYVEKDGRPTARSVKAEKPAKAAEPAKKAGSPKPVEPPAKKKKAVEGC